MLNSRSRIQICCSSSKADTPAIRQETVAHTLHTKYINLIHILTSWGLGLENAFSSRQPVISNDFSYRRSWVAKLVARLFATAAL
jgi:hypothetical protein